MSATVNRGGKIRRKTKSGRVRVNRRPCVVDLESGDKFGLVEKIIGGNQVSIKNHNQLVETVRIPGKMKKKQWIKIGNIVSISADNEITSIVREGDNNYRTATSLLGTTGISFDDDSEESDESDADDPTISMGDKLKKNLIRKEAEKQRDQVRKGGKQFSNPDELDESDKKPIDFDLI